MAVILKGEYIPMRKNLAKLIALMMALVLVFSFAACGGNDEEPTTTSADKEVVTEDAVTPDETGDTAGSEDASANDSQAASDSQAADSNNAGTQGGSTSTSTAIAQPKTTAEGVKVFNDALAKVSGTKTTVQRELTKAKVSILDLNDITNGGASKSFAAGSGPVNVKLSSLNASSVSSFSCTPSGSNYVMTFNLKETSGGASMKHGQGGYMYFLTMSEISDVVMQIGHELGGEGFNVNINTAKTTLTLTGGKLVVTVNKDTGKMSSAVLSFTENIDGKCTTSLLPGNLTADLVGKGTVTFTLS